MILRDDVSIQLFHQRRVAIAEPYLKLVGVVEVLEHGPRRCSPNVILFVINSPVLDERVSCAANTKIHECCVVSNWPGALTRLEHANRDRDGISQSIAPPGERVRHHRLAATVRWSR